MRRLKAADGAWAAAALALAALALTACAPGAALPPADLGAVTAEPDPAEPEFAEARSVADAAAVTARAPDRIMAWPSFVMHGPSRNAPGLRCRTTPPAAAVIQIDPLADEVETNRAIWRQLAQHNRGLLAAGKIDPALGCTAESDPF
jgi:hypothetical protein